VSLSIGRIAATALVALGLLGAQAAGRPGDRESEMKPMGDSSMRLPVEGPLASFEGAVTWINSPPLNPAGLRGKVVLVDFWTYTCVNWLRTLPYVRGWASKYRDRGLVVVGVHTPEFSVEHDVPNVRQAISSMRIDYPVAVDSDYAVWQAFGNAYWPAVYIADAQGRIRYHHFGEGEYEATERVIQQLLVDAGAEGVGRELVAVEPRGTEVAADWSNVRSEEAYVGSDKAVNFASAGGARRGPHVYAIPARLALNHWGLKGEWSVGAETAVVEKPKARIVYRFHARDVNLVMGPGTAGGRIRFRVSIDGHPPGAAQGTDVNAEGEGSVTEPRLYQRSVSRGRSSTATSRSSSWTRARRCSCSRSAERTRRRDQCRSSRVCEALMESRARPVDRRPAQAGGSRASIQAWMSAMTSSRSVSFRRSWKWPL
jgi:thiol-disulfide isomerase/thioredoxin